LGLVHRVDYPLTPDLCAYPKKHGPAELTWVASYILRWCACPKMY